MAFVYIRISDFYMQNYKGKKYNKKERFVNYWHQIDEVLAFNPDSVLEVGVGGHVVHSFLKSVIPDVRSLDIDPQTKPNIVGTITNIPLPETSVDVVLAAEILEHLPFEAFPKALSEIKRVSRLGAVISLPHNGMTFSFSLKIPLIPWTRFVFKIPYFWRKQTMTSEHYWEIGLKGYPLSRVKREMKNAGFTFQKIFIPHDDTYRMFFILKKV